MPETGTQASPSAPAPSPVIPPHLLDPGTFSGTDSTDVEEWLALFERVSKHYRWDETLMLANILFYLRGTARAWYETHEEELTSWDTCKQKLRDLFGRSVARQMAARQELASRVQSSTESYVTYIQDVLALCRKTDKNMSEADKISNVLKGIADDAFNILMCKNCTTVDSIISECRRFEQAKSRRITHHIARLPNTAATSSCEDSAAPRSLAPPANIARIVRQELEAMAPASYQPPAQDNWATVSLIQAVVRQEFANLGVQVPQPARLMPQPMSTPVHNADHHSAPLVAAAASTPRFPPRYRNPSEWRTHDDRPICFSCSRVGHISRHCRNRWYFRPSFPNVDRRQDRGHYSQPGFSDDHIQDPSARRSSPRSEPSYADVVAQRNWSSRSPSPQGRPSRSPQRRRSPSPAYSGHSPGN